MDDLKTLLFRARLLRKRESWGKEAIRVNTRIIELDLGNLAAYTRRARCYQYAGDLVAAREDYTRAGALDPENVHVRDAIKDLDEEVSRRHRDEAYVEEIKRIGDFREVYRLGMSLREGPHRKRLFAIAALERAFLLDRSRYDVLIALARVCRRDRQLDKAERIYEWILRRESNSVAKVGLATVYKDKKRLKEARRLCEEVLAQEPRNSYALRCLAGILSQLDRGAEAAALHARSKWLEDISREDLE